MDHILTQSELYAIYPVVYFSCCTTHTEFLAAAGFRIIHSLWELLLGFLFSTLKHLTPDAYL